MNDCAFLIVAALFSVSVCSVAIGQTLQLKSEAMVDVYILTGQSNSLGTTGSEDPLPLPGADPRDAQIPFYWSNVDAMNTAYPPQLYGDSRSEIKTLGVQQGDDANPTLWGPEIQFARAMDALGGDRRALVIKASRGGGGNGLWDRSSYEANPDAGHMWGHLCDTVDGGLACLVAEGQPFEVRGLLYVQGESNSPAEAAVADTRLSDLAANLKQHIEARYPGTTAPMKTFVGEIAASQSNEARRLTTEKQMQLAARRDDVVFVGTRDLPLKSDGIHFGGREKIEMGRRFADAVRGAWRLED